MIYDLGFTAKRAFRLFVFCSLFFVLCSSSQAQKSKTVLPTNYQLHTVEQGETFYSLSKKYNVSVDSLKDFNALSGKDLKVGQSLKIPLKGKIDAPEFIAHKVQKGETLYAISKQYNVSVEEIQKLNPFVEKGIKKGDVLKIPTNIASANKAETIPVDSSDAQFIFHRIQSGETLYSLSRKYAVFIPNLLSANAEINGNGLKAGQVIKIPKTNSVTAANTISNLPVQKKETVIVKEKPQQDSLNSSLSVRPLEAGRQMQLALMLPLYLDEATAIADTTDNPEIKINSNSLTALEFYEGAMIAADSLKKRGFSFKLHLYDVQNDSGQVKQLLNNQELKKMDLIIGPFYQPNSSVIAKFCKQEKINMVAPILTQPNIVYNNPYISMAVTSVKTQCEMMATKLSEKEFKNQNFIIVHNNANREIEWAGIFKNRISKTNNVKEINAAAKQGMSTLKEALSATTKNIIIVCSSNEAFVTEFLTKLNSYRENNDMTVVGLPTWENFQTLELDLLQHLKVHIFTTSYVEYNQERAKRFRKQYREAYKTEPSANAYQGFDVLYFYLNALLSFGDKVNENLPLAKFSGISSQFDFIKTGERSGYENRAITVLKYENYQLIRIE